MKQRLALVFGLWNSMSGLRAQLTSWPPAGANLAYACTLLAPGALAQVRAALVALARLAVYRSLWANVQRAPLRYNTSPGGRQARSAWAKNAAFIKQWPAHFWSATSSFSAAGPQLFASPGGGLRRPTNLCSYLMLWASRRVRSVPTARQPGWQWARWCQAITTSWLPVLVASHWLAASACY